MYQYRFGNYNIIQDKSGQSVKVNQFRNRNSYPEDLTIFKKADQNDIKRIDILSIKTYGSFDAIGAIIDSNEKDIFSFNIGENIFYPVRGVELV